MGLIALRQRILIQPQYPPAIAPEFRGYSPRIMALPVSNNNLVNSQPLTYVGNASRVAGYFHFPGVVGTAGYVDLGGETIFDPYKPCSIVIVSRLTSFTSAFPIIAGFKSSDGYNLTVFYSNSGGYADVTVGTGILGGQGYLLPAGVSVTGTWHIFVVTYDGTGVTGGFRVYCNGVALKLNGSGGISSASGNSVLGMYSALDTTIPLSGDVQTVEYYGMRFKDSRALDVSSQPWITYQAPTRRIFYVPVTGVTLTGGTSTQANTGSSGAISRTLALTGATSTQANAGSAAGITQAHALTGAASTQANAGSAGAVTGAGNLAGAASVEVNAGSSGAITQAHILAGAACTEVNAASGGAVTQSNALAGAASAQVNAGAAGAISVAHNLVCAPSVQDNIAAASPIVQAHMLAAAAASQANASASVAITVSLTLTGGASTQGNIGGIGQITRPQTLTGAGSVQTNLSGTGATDNGIVSEAALTTGIAPLDVLSKPGIPAGTDEWLKTMLEIIIGRRGNAIDPPKFQTLTFSASPTQAECQALYAYTNDVRRAVASILTRLDS